MRFDLSSKPEITYLILFELYHITLPTCYLILDLQNRGRFLLSLRSMGFSCILILDFSQTIHAKNH